MRLILNAAPPPPAPRSAAPPDRRRPAPAEVVADHLLGELAGWDRCREATGVRHGAGRPPSIHEVLRPLLDRRTGGDTAALAPGPVVDPTLRRLVALVTAHHGHPDGQLQGDLRRPSPASNHRRHLEVVAEVGRRLDGDPVAAARAAEIQAAAGLAEAAMEQHFARRALRSPPAPAATGGSRHRGPRRLAPVAAPSHGPLDWPARQEVIDPTDPTRRRIRQLWHHLASFPYLANYEQLTASELAGLRAAGSAEGPVAFCGAGALPLTGIVLHILTDAPVTLFEIDAPTADLADRLCRRLAGDGVLRPGAVQVVEADAATLDPTRFTTVVAASLLPAPTVAALAAAVAAVPPGRTRPTLAVRSARGLAARFVYPPVALDRAGTSGLRHLGTVAPLTAVSFEPAGSGTRPESGDGVAIPFTSPTLLAVAPAAVLNSTEVLG